VPEDEKLEATKGKEILIGKGEGYEKGRGRKLGCPS
jgi:hypothetical protein